MTCLPNMISSNNILIIEPTTRGHTLGFHIAVALQKRKGFTNYCLTV